MAGRAGLCGRAGIVWLRGIWLSLEPEDCGVQWKEAGQGWWMGP